MQSALQALVVIGIVVRVALDVLSFFKPVPWFNLAYASLFGVIGIAAVAIEGTSLWALACFGIAAFSVFVHVTKRGGSESL